jgi:uncharacterized protein YlxP (DUF503 family)
MDTEEFRFLARRGDEGMANSMARSRNTARGRKNRNQKERISRIGHYFMFIYCLELHLSLPTRSLKEKRGIVKSILGRARNRFNVACAEVDRQDNPAVAVLGFVSISPDKAIARNVLVRLEDWIYEGWPDVEITGSDISEV